MIDYLNSFQIYACIYVIVAIGYGCSALKIFVSRDVDSIRRILNYVAIPGLIFRQIGLTRFKLDTFVPLLVGVLTQATLQIVIAIISFVLPFESKTQKYISYFYSNSYSEILFVGLPIVQFIYGDDYVYVPVMLSMVQFLILTPIHNIVMFRILGPPTQTIEMSDDADDEREIELDDADAPEGPITKIETDGNEHEYGQQHGAKSNIIDIKQPLNPSAEVLDKKGGDDDDENKGGKIVTITVKTVWTTLLWSLVNPINVCFVLGIIWSATGWTMMKFLESFVNDLEKAVVAAGLFTSGVFMWEHPFFGCSPVEVPLCTIVHAAVIPLVGALWCWLLNLDNTVTRAVILCYAAPSALSSYASAIQNGMALSTITYTFFWTYMISLPVYLLWTVVFNQANLFPTD